MCGIAGKINLEIAAPADRSEISAMLAPMRHRGPDGQGIHLDRNLGLGHLRLSIIDLSTGDQPMANEDQTIWIVFNGEIYNFQELRQSLLGNGHVFRSRSDTEVIIHAYEQYGPDCVTHLRGMFAFAIWDAKRRRLFMARDRVGIKPLYYCQTARAFYFASELKAILADPDVSREVDPCAIRQFLSFNYLAGEQTLFASIKKLPPGHTLAIENGHVAIHQYWDLRFTGQRWPMPFDQAVEELSGRLKSTVRDHMIADVPVGVLLSGGVDSSAVLSFAVQGTAKKVKTFTVGFDGDQVVDERPYARLAAQQFGTEHYDLSICPEDFWNFLPSYVWHMEEPVCEPPAVALYYVSRMARQHIKVLLSGEGGDEAFAGYPNYPNMLRLQRIQQALGPLAPAAGLAASALGGLFRLKRFHRYAVALGQTLASHYFSRTSGPTAFFNRRAARFLSPEFFQATRSVSPQRTMARLLQPVNGCGLLDQMLYADTKTWLPDDLLIKADKMTMANSVELRVPLLDHRVMEFAASLPPQFKLNGFTTKYILKKALSERVPQAIRDRKKTGFPVPYEAWLRTEMKDAVWSVLTDPSTARRGYFRPEAVEALLKANADGASNAKEVFSLLTVELWHRAFLSTQ
jgi:asparagine synthase (glutamine-hydrolysing)